jgi:hypothetical protein
MSREKNGGMATVIRSYSEQQTLGQTEPRGPLGVTGKTITRAAPVFPAPPRVVLCTGVVWSDLNEANA